MQIEQFVMAYEVDQGRLRAILPDGFSSLRPVLRINAEIHNCRFGYIEFIYLRKPETISSDKEFCDCKFRWSFSKKDACGKSMGKTIPAFFKEPMTIYPKKSFTVENATEILCKQVLGSYAVVFDR